jgi:hypothetical protein
MGVVSVTVKEAAEKISQITQGTLLTHIALMDMLEANKRQYASRVESLKKILKSEYGLFIYNEHNVGYRLALPGDEINVCEGRVNKGKGIIFSSVKDMQKIRIDKITDKDKLNATIQKSQESANLLTLMKYGKRLEAAPHNQSKPAQQATKEQEDTP